MNYGIKLIAVFMLTFGLAVVANAQETTSPRKGKLTEEQRVEKKLEKMNKVADEAKMTDEQREKFIASQLEFSKAAKELRQSNKEEFKSLAVEQKEYLATFLSTEQMEILQKERQKNKGNRKGKKHRKERGSSMGQ